MPYDESTSVSVSDPLPMEANTRPTWGYNPRTHEYWYKKIMAACHDLDIDERAGKARDRKKKYQQYEFEKTGAKKQTVNAISRQLTTFKNNVISDQPVVTPQFLSQADEELWRDKIQSFAEANLRQQDIKGILDELMWDNFYGDISWLKADWVTAFAPSMPTDPTESKRRAIAEEALVAQEHQQIAMGMGVFTAPENMHPLHITLHREELARLTAIGQEIEVATQGGMLPPDQLAWIQQQTEMLDLHIAEHVRADKRIDDEVFEAQRWPSYMVVYDPDARKWKDADWYAVEVIERREVLMQRSDFKNVKPLKGVAGLDWDELRENKKDGQSISAGPVLGTGQAPTETYIRYWIVHDRVTDSLVVVADQERHDQKPLVVAEWPFDGDIIAPFVLNPVNDRIHGVSQIARLEFVHDQLVAVEKKIAECIDKIPAMKIAVNGSIAGDETLRNDVMNPQRMYINCGNTPVKEAVNFFTFPGIDQNLMQRRMDLLNELQLETGIPEVYNAGESDETATATAVRDRQAGNKINEAKKALSRLLEWFCTTMVDTFRLHGNYEQWVRVTGGTGLAWDTFTPESIPHGITWMVDSDSLAPTKRELEQKQQLEFLQVFSAFFGTYIVNPLPIIRSAIRKFGIVEDVGELFRPDQTMMQVQAYMAQQQALMGQMGAGGGAGGAEASPLTPDSQNGVLGNDVGGELAPAATV